MGMTIDIDGSIKELSKWRNDLNFDNGDYCYGDDTTRHSLDVAIDIMRKYLRLQADYETRLKADMVAMLDELDLELYEQYEDTDSVKVKYIRQSIQEKIDKLKGERNED